MLGLSHVRGMEGLNPERLAALADYVRLKRKAKGLTQQGIELKGGPKHGWVGALESASLTGTPKVNTLYRLAAALDVPVREILEIVGFPELDERALPSPLASSSAVTLTEEEQQLLQRYAELPPDDRGEVLDWMELKLRRHRKKPPSGPPEGDLGRQ